MAPTREPPAPSVRSLAGATVNAAAGITIAPARGWLLRQALDGVGALPGRDHPKLAGRGPGRVGARGGGGARVQVLVLATKLGQLGGRRATVLPGTDEVHHRADVRGEDPDQDEHQDDPAELVPTNPAPTARARARLRAQAVGGGGGAGRHGDGFAID